MSRLDEERQHKGGEAGRFPNLHAAAPRLLAAAEQMVRVLDRWPLGDAEWQVGGDGFAAYIALAAAVAQARAGQEQGE